MAEVSQGAEQQQTDANINRSPAVGATPAPGEGSANPVTLTEGSSFFSGLPALSNSQNLYIHVRTGPAQHSEPVSLPSSPSSGPASSIRARASRSSGDDKILAGGERDFYVTVPWQDVAPKMLEHPQLVASILATIKNQPNLRNRAIRALSTSSVSSVGSEASSIAFGEPGPGGPSPNGNGSNTNSEYTFSSDPASSPPSASGQSSGYGSMTLFNPAGLGGGEPYYGILNPQSFHGGTPVGVTPSCITSMRASSPGAVCHC